MKRWLRSRKKKTGSGGGDTPGIELLVLEGVDTGQKFTIDADEVLIGRRLDDEELSVGVLLRDATVSARQAVIRLENGNHIIHHLPEATNPTMVNGYTVDTAMLVPGSQIQIGRILIDVRSRGGTGLRDFTQLYAPALPLAQAKSNGTQFSTEVLDLPTAELGVDDMLHGPKPHTEIGWLEVREDPDRAESTRHALRSGRTVIGRSADSDLCITDLGVSRHHAELQWEGKNLVLYHKSGTNLTMLNRQEVTHRMVVQSGDEILLAGRVSIVVDLDPSVAAPSPAAKNQPTGSVSPVDPSPGHGNSGLRAAMEQKAAIERRIAEDFSVNGSFVDIDVVNSMGMKTDIKEPERIILSFERFRTFVGNIVEEFEGHVLNSNGDELMCFFASSVNAVRAGSAVFSRLEEFNSKENVLDEPFRFRIGVHTGQSLVDLKRGIAYSATLDTAGHLQKIAEPNHMAISEHTMAALPKGLPFKLAGTLERENFDYYVLDGLLD